MKPVSATIMFLTFLLAAVSAQSQMPAPKPGPELKKLDYFVGTWTMDGDLKPGPMGPGGKMTGTERIEWMDGGFFLTSHSNFKSAMGNGTGLAVMGYTPTTRSTPTTNITAWEMRNTPRARWMVTPGLGPATKKWAGRP